MALAALGLSCSRSSNGILSALVKSMLGLGMVSVPVLSMTRALTLRMFSRAEASLIRICFWAALPMPTIKAVGVARPMAQGQATTRTETADKMAWGRAALPPMAHQARNVMRAMVATTGTNTMAALSTIR